MAEIFRILGRNRGLSGKAGTREPDIAVAPARRWALGVMVVASAGALLATSAPVENMYNFEVASEEWRTTLTPSAPAARYLVRAQVTALGPEGVDTTRTALATVHAVVSANADTPRPFVRVRLGEPGNANASLASAESSLRLAQPLRFTGNCADPGKDTPCTAELELDFDFEHPSALSADAIVSIGWTIDFESTVPKPKGGEGQESLAAPWTIEIDTIAEP